MFLGLDYIQSVLLLQPNLHATSAAMKPFFGLRGTGLNIMIGVIAGLDFLYVGLSMIYLRGTQG